MYQLSEKTFLIFWGLRLLQADIVCRKSNRNRPGVDRCYWSVQATRFFSYSIVHGLNGLMFGSWCVCGLLRRNKKTPAGATNALVDYWRNDPTYSTIAGNTAAVLFTWWWEFFCSFSLFDYLLQFRWFRDVWFSFLLWLTNIGVQIGGYATFFSSIVAAIDQILFVLCHWNV